MHDNDIHGKSVQARIKWLLDLNREHSTKFCSPGAILSRERYLANHPSKLIVFKCMDGRIHLPVITKMPMGTIQPFRNLGGRFDLGWPYLGELVNDSVFEAVRSGRKVIILVTYHFSKGDTHRGCAGFDYDCEAAVEAAYSFKRQLEYVFGSEHQVVYPVVCGVETDEDALQFHGQRDEVFSLSDVQDASEGFLRAQLQKLYSDMPADILNDLMPLVIGNAKHISETRKTERQLSIEHREWAICIGRGFDFLHVPNVALIIGPFSPNLTEPIVRAAGIIDGNMKSGRIPSDGFLLLASAPFDDIGPDKKRAKLKAQTLGDFAYEMIARELPDVAKLMIRKTAVLQWSTRALQEIEKRK